MIEWMQTHRKWLVITIWIATIAFVGAGFVGWGQVQFGKNSSTIAKVQDTEISIQDVQDTYNKLYQELNQKMGGNLDEATAKKLGLQTQAIELAIQEGMLRQYAKDLGLYVTDKDVAKKILEYFKDKETYKQYLKNTGLKPSEFEKRLRKRLLIEKLLTFLHIKPSNTELLSIASALYNADNMEIKILSKKDIHISLDENEIKTYWEKNKNKFQSPEKYKIAYIDIPLTQEVSENELKKYYEENKLNYKNEKGEIISFKLAKEQVKKDYLTHKLKKEAILAYKKLKNSKGNYKIITVTLNNLTIPTDKMLELIKNGYLKPFVYKNSYITAKLLEEIKPKPLSFEKAKSLVITELLNIKTSKALVEKAKTQVKTFKGEETGFITKYDFNKINLSPILAQEFLFNVFISQNQKGFVLLPHDSPEYAVLYKIKEQKLLEKKKYEENKKNVYNLTEALLNTEMLQDLIAELSQKYKVEKYIKD